MVNTKMKIGLVLDTTLDYDAGVQQYFKGLARFLITKGHDVKFLVPPSKDEGEFKGRIISFGKNVRPKGSTTSVPGVFLLGGGRHIKRTLNKERFDILHISAPFSPFLGSKIVKYASCPIVATYMICSSNQLVKMGLILLKFLLMKVYEKIDAFIALSDIAREEAEITIPGNYTVIPIGVNVERFSPKVSPVKKFSNGKMNILFVGRLERRKGVNYLISAFKKVKSEFRDVRLIIVGDGPLRRKLKELVDRLELKDVVFEGYIDEELKPKYYAAADLCVFPAIYGESFGVVLIEAMAAGKVTIGYSNEGYSFVLKNLPELLVENKDISKLAEKISKFLENEELRGEYEEKCLVESQRFKWKKIGLRILHVYKKLLRTNRT